MDIKPRHLAVSGVGDEFFFAVAVDIDEQQVVRAAVVLFVNQMPCPAVALTFVKDELPVPRFGDEAATDDLELAVAVYVGGDQPDPVLSLVDDTPLKGVGPVPEQRALTGCKDFAASLVVYRYRQTAQYVGGGSRV